MTSARRLPWLLASLALATSCASSPPVQTPPWSEVGVDLPEKWTAPTPTASPAAESTTPSGSSSAPESASAARPWWETFGDDRLAEVIETALERNHDLRAAATRIFAAAAQARSAGADALPQISAGFAGDRSRQNFIGLPFPGLGDVLPVRATSLGVSLDLSWEADVWGRIRSGRSAALADVEASEAEFEATRLSLAGQSAKLWFALVDARRQVELARATLENFRSAHDRIERRYRRGLRPSLDVRLSRSNVAAAESTLAERERARDQLARQLEVLLGRYPEGTISPVADLPELPGPVPAGLPAELVARRPDLRAAERRLAASGARVRQAKAALLPRFSLTTSVGTNSSELGDLLDGDFSVWRLAGNLVQPLFQGGRLLAGLDLASARQREALELWVQTALRAFGEVETYLAAAVFLDRQEEALRIAAEESVRARELAEDRYERGLDDIITLLEAQRRAFQAESNLLSIRRERLENRVDLHLALGGDFAARRAREVEGDGPDGPDGPGGSDGSDTPAGEPANTQVPASEATATRRDPAARDDSHPS